MVTTTALEQETLQTVNLGQHFQIGPAGLVVIGKPTFDAFDALGETLRTLDRSLQFALGDFFREVEKRFGEDSGLPEREQRASQILHHTGWSESTLRVYLNTAKRVPAEIRRMDRLTYSHHQQVASLKLAPKEQKRWLDRAADDEKGPWPVSRLRDAIKAGRDEEPRSWVLVAFCDSESKRDKLLKELESRGIRCRSSERRGEKKLRKAS